MKNILLIGVGGTGSRAVEIFYKKKDELGSQTGNKVTALVFDTDAGDLKNITAAKTVALADTASVGTICDRFGKEFLSEWFPCDDKAVRSQEMIRGASQWRKKSYLAFLNLMHKPLTRATFISALEGMIADPGASCEVYVIASIAGGTGSGSFIPIALYAKRYLRKNLGKDPIVNAMIALPDIFADSQTPENKIKVYSNAYAILRELNAINLVARGYNAGRAAEKKAPIKFRIGHPDEPSVGVLFDASDRQFWTPEAAPFSQIFLLDKIPGINSVEAHNIVLANSLYTMLCTEIGSAFDSEFSNHELLRSQNNGSNAIYAGISTSQIRFPKESVLDYLAHQKTLESCDNEWLILHNAVEREIKEREREQKAVGGRYMLGDGDYANILLDQLEEAEEGCEALISLVGRSLEPTGKDNVRVKKEKTVSDYVALLDEKFIGSKLPTPSKDLKDAIDGCVEGDAKPNTDNVIEAARNMYENVLLTYYKECVESVKRTIGSTTDSILTLDSRKQEFVGKDYSLVDKLLKNEGKFYHPVICMIQLCLARREIGKKLVGAPEKWISLSKRDLSRETIPNNLLQVNEATVSGKSAYANMDAARFANIIDKTEEYTKDKTNAKNDLEQLGEDGKNILNKIYIGAKQQLKAAVYKQLAESIDILIAKYRNFFSRFIKEKEDLEESTKTALKKDSESIDSVINVYSSVEDKKNIFKYITEEAGPVTDAELAEVDDVVGKGVYTTVYGAASAQAMGGSFNEKDSGAYRSLFNGMIESYKKSIQKSEAFEQLASYNVVEAVRASCGEDAKKMEEAFRAKFAVAQDLAKPSLRVDTSENLTELVQPSEIMVFMISKNTGRYIKKHAEELGLRLPADQNDENSVIKSCSEQFIRNYSGNSSARVSIVDSISDQVLYCTGEIMDITPLRISKFDELGTDNLYFKNYTTAINNFKKYGTDMWNPHIGNNLYKRGYLPYMNEEKEDECDKQMVKALLYAFQKKIITYSRSSNKYFFEWSGKKITDAEGRWIGKNNIAQLLAWMRNEDELIELWSAQFDAEIARQINALPSLASDNSTEISKLESALTNTGFMRMLTDSLYEDKEDADKAAGKRPKLLNGKLTVADRVGPTVLEFAYMIKTSEEIGRDCDDAERILKVVYEIFEKMCEYRTNPDSNPERFIQVYKQQLGNVLESFAASKVVCESGTECKAHFRQMLVWLNGSGLFNTISDDTPMDETGKVVINVPFDFEKDTATNDVKKILNFVCGKMKDTDDDEDVEDVEKVAAEPEAVVEEADAE